MTRKEAIEQLTQLRKDSLQLLNDAGYTSDRYCRYVEALDMAIDALNSQRRTIKEALQSEDWSELTVQEIAEALGCTRTAVLVNIRKLREQGYEVNYKRLRPNKNLASRLQSEDWSDYTLNEIAEALDSTCYSVSSAINRLKLQGVDVEYKRRKPGRPKKERT